MERSKSYSLPIPEFAPVIKAVFPRISLPRNTAIAVLSASNLDVAFFLVIEKASLGSMHVVRLLTWLRRNEIKDGYLPLYLNRKTTKKLIPRIRFDLAGWKSYGITIGLMH